MTTTPDRFYKTVSIDENDGVFSVLLDGRSAKSRQGKILAVKNSRLAACLMEEWDEQETKVDFSSMPMTRYQMAVMDMESSHRIQWIDEVLSYLRNDLLCYRAESPAALSQLQEKVWNPILDYVKDEYDLELVSTYGIINVEQSAGTLEKAKRILLECGDAQLLSIRRVMELTGSSILGLAVYAGLYDAAKIVEAAHLDELWQAEQWGFDKEAAERREGIVTEIEEAIRYLVFFAEDNNAGA